MKKLAKEVNNNDVLIITKYIVEKYKIIQPVKLQKILYFLYLDYLKQTGKKLFDDEFEAWVYGPVLPKVFYHIKNYGFNFEFEEDFVLVEISTLNNPEIELFINKNIKKYLKYSTFALIEMSHETEPWKNARKGLKANKISKTIINFNDLKEFSQAWEL